MDQATLLAIVGDLELSRREAVMEVAALQARVAELEAQLASEEE